MSRPWRKREQSASDTALDEAYRAERAAEAERDEQHKLVELIRVDAIEAEIVACQLRNANIPAFVFGIGTAGLLSAIQHAQGSRVMVRRINLDEARVLVAVSYAKEPSDDIASDAELAALADESEGWSDPETGATV